jgi:hypothetical protein
MDRQAMDGLLFLTSIRTCKLECHNSPEVDTPKLSSFEQVQMSIPQNYHHSMLGYKMS